MGDEAFNETDIPLDGGGCLTVRARAGDREPIYVGWCPDVNSMPEVLAKMTDEECNELCRAIRNLQGAARGRKEWR